VNTFEEKIGGFLVEFTEKPEEQRVFISARNISREGKRSEPLTTQQETAAAMLAKDWYEQHRGVMLLNFHKDPLAGGLRPQVAPKGQLYRAGVEREEAFVMTPKGLVSQGKVGAVKGNRQSNIERGNTIMIATPLWTGEWI
jgi:hypothetical protein